MTGRAEFGIAEIPYPSGAVRFRYSRIAAPGGQSWLRHGPFVEYAENGSVLSDGQYVDGKEEGLWRDFYSNGKLASEGKYERGLEHGEWRFWDERGNDERRVTYDKGVEVG